METRRSKSNGENIDIVGSHIRIKSSGTRSGSIHQRLLRTLREKYKLLGFFEIDSAHELYSQTCMIKTGIQHAIQLSIDNPNKAPLTEEDFTSVQIQTFEGFEIGTFAGPAFAQLRRFLGLTEKDYQLSLSSSLSYLQFISNSKSKADFFLSNDKRFFLKTQNKAEVQFLLSNLALYIEHLHQYPHSLIVKFLGVHSLKVAREKKKYFIIMQSIFYPDDRITERYDIKGCQASRWTKPLLENKPIILVLKDLNFEGHTISLGPQRKWLLKQIELDTNFLRGLNVLDYSLLVAFQKLHEDEKCQRKNLIVRTAKSLYGARKSETIAVSNLTLDTVESGSPSVLPSFSSFKKKTSSASVNLDAQNLRLLPDVPNALHILDGPEYRYFLGIIDFFTVYNYRKRLEKMWKSVRYPGRSFSTVTPEEYASRLCEWVDAHTV